MQPGWNLAGWLGFETEVSELFDAIPALRSVWAWDGDHQRYIWATRNGNARGLSRLSTGTGVWLLIDGVEPVEWTRAVAPEGMLLSLHEGRNLVGWSGDDRTPFSEVAARFGGTLLRATRWNAEAERFEQYVPDADNDLRELNRGDAFLLDLSADARWWRPGTGRTVFELPDDLPAERQVEIRDALADVLGFFAEYYGIAPPRFAVIVDADLTVLANATLERIALSDRAAREGDVLGVLAHEYFHVLQLNFVAGSEQRFASSPIWLHEGAAEYVRGLYLREHGPRTSEQQRSWRWLNSTSLAAGLQAYERGSFGTHAGAEYLLGALAVEWLEGHATAAAADEGSFEPVQRGWPDRVGGGGAYIDYYRLLSSSSDWKEAFETAFSIGVDEFYEAFEEYRTALGASRLPHLADDHNQPFLVLLGDIEEVAEATIRADFDGLQALFRERFGGPAADYSIFFVGSDQSAEDALQSTFGWDLGPAPISLGPGITGGLLCSVGWQDVRIMIVFQQCRADLPEDAASLHFSSVRNQLVLGASTPSWPGEVDLPEPLWLRDGTEEYAEYAHQGLDGDEDPDWLWSRFAASAVATTQPLASIERWSVATGPFETSSLGFLASDWLADHAGEASLLEYYRLVPSSANWQEAFEGAFGMTVDDFYAAFEPYRREVAPVIPHRADERAEPILVFTGEVPDETRAAIRAEFQTAQEFFGERLGAGPADYSVYVAADTALVTPPFMMAFWMASGATLPQRLCHRQNGSVALFITLECGTSLAHYLSDYHFSNALVPVAHQELVPPAEAGLHFWGPDWLWRGLRSYVKYAYLDAAGFETLDETRRTFASLAVGTTRPLREIEAYAPAWRDEAYNDDRYDALAFFAADRLVQRAGEPAIFEYFRSLSSSESWREAFEGTFGVTVDDFYEAFEEHRGAFADLAAGSDGE